MPLDQIREFIGWILWAGATVAASITFRIQREIDSAYDLWGRVPTILGTLRRTGLQQAAKGNKSYPRLLANLRELAAKLRIPFEGAFVGGGCRGFYAVTSDPGILYLF